jgi:hypothetical protein
MGLALRRRGAFRSVRRARSSVLMGPDMKLESADRCGGPYSCLSNIL